MKLHQSEQGNKDEEGADEGWPGHSMAFERILSGKKKIACDSPSLCQTWNVSNGFLTGFHWTVKKLFHKFGDRFQSSLRWDWERPAKNLLAPNFSLNSLISRWERRKKWKILFNLYYVFFSLICYEVMSYGNGCFILLSVWSSFNIIGPYSTALVKKKRNLLYFS